MENIHEFWRGIDLTIEPILGVYLEDCPHHLLQRIKSLLCIRKKKRKRKIKIKKIWME